MQVTLALIALALGYKVYIDGSREKEGLKLLGQSIGVVVMIVALLSAACGVTRCMMKQGCSLMKKDCSMMSKASCPLSRSSDSPSNP